MSWTTKRVRYLGIHRRRDHVGLDIFRPASRRPEIVTVSQRIKVTVPEKVIYYDVVYDQKMINTVGHNAPIEVIAKYEQEQFRAGDFSWEDIIGNATREDVTFEGIDE